MQCGENQHKPTTSKTFSEFNLQYNTIKCYILCICIHNAIRYTLDINSSNTNVLSIAADKIWHGVPNF